MTRTVILRKEISKDRESAKEIETRISKEIQRAPIYLGCNSGVVKYDHNASAFIDLNYEGGYDLYVVIDTIILSRAKYNLSSYSVKVVLTGDGLEIFLALTRVKSYSSLVIK